MKLVRNSGTDRVIDLIRPRIGHGTLKAQNRRNLSFRTQHGNIIAALWLAPTGAWAASCAHTRQFAASDIVFDTIPMTTTVGAAEVDVYRPHTAARVPVVIVVHGFSRSRQTMSGWGQHLGGEGFGAIVPHLLTWSGHTRNSQFISGVQAYFSEGEAWKERLDSSRIGMVRFSSGGLSSVLSASASPRVAPRVGFDPVNGDGLDAVKTPMLQRNAVAISAEPSACNTHGNAPDMISPLPRYEHFSIPGADHMDAEWPTSWFAQLLLGRSTDEGRCVSSARNQGSERFIA